MPAMANTIHKTQNILRWKEPTRSIHYAKAFHQINSWEEDAVWKVNECKGELSSEFKARDFPVPLGSLFKLCINAVLLSGFLLSPRYWYFHSLLHRLSRGSGHNLAAEILLTSRPALGSKQGKAGTGEKPRVENLEK